MRFRRATTLSLIGVTLALGSGCSGRPASTPGRPVDSRPSVSVTANASAASPAVCGSGIGTDASPLRGQGAIQMAGLVFFNRGSHPQVGVSTKFVWRVTGTGPAEFTGTGPNGATVQPDWGPDPHGTASNFDEPGDEWGMAFTFPTAGCWTIQTRRGSAMARAGVTVTRFR